MSRSSRRLCGSSSASLLRPFADGNEGPHACPCVHPREGLSIVAACLSPKEPPPSLFPQNGRRACGWFSCVGSFVQRRRGSCGGQSSRGGAGQLPCGPAQDKNQETKFGRFRMLAVASAQEPRYRFRAHTALLSRATEDINFLSSTCRACRGAGSCTCDSRSR